MTRLLRNLGIMLALATVFMMLLTGSFYVMTWSWSLGWHWFNGNQVLAGLTMCAGWLVFLAAAAAVAWTSLDAVDRRRKEKGSEECTSAPTNERTRP